MNRRNTNLCAFVRDYSDLRRSCGELSELLAFHQGGARASRLLGIWVDLRIIGDKLPLFAVLDERAGNRRCRYRDSISLSGVWTMCSLHTDDITRLELMDAVLGNPQQSGVVGTSGQFIPVFNLDEAENDIALEMRRLVIRYPGRVGPPILQHPTSGRLLPTTTETAVA